MTLKNRPTQGGPLEAVVIAETDKGVVFIPGPTAVVTVGSHSGPVSVPDEGLTLAKPETATHVQLQSFVQNIRYVIDDSSASVTRGFQLIPGSIVPIPVPNATLIIFPEMTPGSVIQLQWIKAR